MAKTNRPIFIREPGELFTDNSPDAALDHETRKKVDKALSAADSAQKRIKKLQDKCKHPITAFDYPTATYQCLVCGFRRLHKFDS